MKGIGVHYLVFCEGHPAEAAFRAGSGGTLKLSNGIEVRLSFDAKQQYWIDATGKATTLAVAFTAEEVKRLADSSRSLPDEDIKTLQDIRRLLNGNP